MYVGREKEKIHPYPIKNSFVVKEPANVTVPKPFKGTMRISVRITKLVVISMSTHPIYRIPL